MKHVLACLTAAAALAALTTAADARPHHRHGHRHAVTWQHRYAATHPEVMHDVLIANPLDDVIIDGKTGFHRSDWGVMVPDTEPQSFVATGRASGSCCGANGVPGSNWQ